MSNEYIFYIGTSLKKEVNKPIRNQLDIIILLLKTIQDLITPNSETVTKKKTNEQFKDVLKIIIPNQSKEKLQRIFFYKTYPDCDIEEMYTIQSFCFPFKIMNEKELTIEYNYSGQNFKLNAYFISRMITIFNILKTEERTWGNDWMEEMLDILYEKENEENLNLLFYIINELLMFDYGYLRFDNDPKHQSDNHPRYHFDVHMDNKTTFKLGINNPLSIDKFIKSIDNNSEIIYLNNL